MEVKKTILDGCHILEPIIFKDSRGLFLESFNEKRFEACSALSNVNDEEEKIGTAHACVPKVVSCPAWTCNVSK